MYIYKHFKCDYILLEIFIIIYKNFVSVEKS